MLSYFEKEVNFNRIFGRDGLALPNKANAQAWIDKIENDLSPENLCCDGELPRSQVLLKKRELDKAMAEMKALLVVSPRIANEFGYTNRVPLQNTDQINQYNRAFRVVRATQKRERTAIRAGKLSAAIQDGFRVGVRVILSNGLRGTITKINRTRVKVMTETKGMYNVPPSCMRKA